ncbi:uncharacterized protein [Amphiura filiformis]|uniref:uncharacterized protein n=1 Tax=Amphiura filiformis TaxID=82378 RepID=UPI003B218F4D
MDFCQPSKQLICLLILMHQWAVSSPQSTVTPPSSESNKGEGDDMKWLVYSMGALVGVSIVGILILLIVCVRLRYKERNLSNIFKWEIKHNAKSGQLRPSLQHKTREKVPAPRNNNTMKLSRPDASHLYQLPNLREDFTGHQNRKQFVGHRTIPIEEDDAASIIATAGSVFAEPGSVLVEAGTVFAEAESTEESGC